MKKISLKMPKMEWHTYLSSTEKYTGSQTNSTKVYLKAILTQTLG